MQECTNNPGAKVTKANADEHALAIVPAIKAAIAAGANGLVKMADLLNAEAVPTPRGGKWRIETVRRTRQRLVGLGYAELKVKPRSRHQARRKLMKLCPEAGEMQKAEAMAIIAEFKAKQKTGGKWG